MNVGIGPVGSGKQGYLLARALREAGIEAESFGLADSHEPPLRNPVDRSMTRAEWRTKPWRDYVARFSHLLMWCGHSPFHPNQWWDSDLGRPARIAVAFQGSDLRDPTVHRRLERWSPHADPTDELTVRLQRVSDACHARLRAHDVPAFVATLGMLDYLPSARWLPVIVEQAKPGPLLRRRRPIAVYLPTNGQLKGMQYVDALALSNTLDVQHPPLMRPEKALAAIAHADIVIGGLVLGDVAATEAEGMAAGRVVVANVSKRVRDRLEMPIVQADPETLADVLCDIEARRDFYREFAAQGPAFVERFHDGRYAVAQLGDFLAAEAVAA